MIEHRLRIKNRIIDALQEFKDSTIDFYTLRNTVMGNIKAIDNLDNDLEHAAFVLCGELEIIHYTVDSEKEHEEMLKEVAKFEPYLEKL